MTEVTRIDTKKYMEEPCFRRALCDVSPLRRKKAESYHFMKDRALSLGASVLLDGALSGYGLREKDMTYDKEKNGKPCFPGHFPFHFSISHSGTMAALAVSDRPVGCDIQIEKEADIRLAERFFAPSERAYVEAASDPGERDRRFFRCWSLKESFAKALGDGLGRPMGSYAVVNEKGRALCPALFEIPYAFTEIPVPGYAFAVCAPAEDPPVLTRC